MNRDDAAPPVRYCPACDRALPIGVEPADCPGCAEDRRRAARRREWERARARLGPAPLARSRNLAYWSLVSAAELLEVALHYVEGAEHDAMARALAHVHAASRELERRRA